MGHGRSLYVVLRHRVCRHRSFHLHRRYEESGRHGLHDRRLGVRGENDPGTRRGVGHRQPAVARDRRLRAAAVKILVCTDGERHTRGAVERAISLGLSRSAEVTALHVIDTWLKQFHNEIHAQGRRKYLDYVDDCLREEAARVRREFSGMCHAEGLQAGFKVRHGEPLEEILDEVCCAAPDLLITGSKPLTAWGRLRSGNLPARLSRRLGKQTAMITVRTEVSRSP
ncbi:MAG: universal stress protein [Proteobacteria bacterium]|nr:universal stress protein [Pseudomonadota bacterium]